MELKHEVRVTPAYDLRHSNPRKDYGITPCLIFFLSIGPKGAVQFAIGTDWYTQTAQEHLKSFPPLDLPQPQPWDIGYHAKEPQYEGQPIIDHNCEYVGGPCYYDGSTLQAKNWIEGFVSGGTDWLWPRLDQLYIHRFEDGGYPDLTPTPRKHED